MYAASNWATRQLGSGAKDAVPTSSRCAKHPHKILNPRCPSSHGLAACEHGYTCAITISLVMTDMTGYNPLMVWSNPGAGVRVCVCVCVSKCASVRVVVWWVLSVERGKANSNIV
jgi:hypothetical protein